LYWSAALTGGIHLIVGLGNPGSDYAATRHNAGAWYLQDIAQSESCSLKIVGKFSGMHGVVKTNGGDLHLLFPTTFMNLSGQAVAAVAHYYKIPSEAILIVHDEIDLPVGDIRLKFGGGHGGHNGLRDIISHLNSNNFYRLRVGVGRPVNQNDVINYVLKSPGKNEREQINIALTAGIQILPLLLQGQFQQAMQQLHTREN
jgi:PTH1 family peptidyl-tRNA hydrolase